MKFEQKESFKPITLIIESSDEAVALWDLMRFAIEGAELEKKPAALARKISNWFSQEAKL